MIWFTSDLHYGHKAVIKLCDRPFKTVEKMNETLMRNWNSTVAKNNTVYILGDISHRCKVEKASNFISQLKGNKILIRGNHDKEYDALLFKGIFDYYELKGYASVSISLMHYPMLEWNRSRHGSLHLHGHQHNKEAYNDEMRKQGIRRYDVGVDANQYCPVSLNHILDFFQIEK